MILDGFGIAPRRKRHCGGKTPNLDRLFEGKPAHPNRASGMDVGLPDGQMGNS